MPIRPDRQSDETAELEMTPMIDVTFLLLIFFMCTLRFKTLEGRLAANLPTDVGVNVGLTEPPEAVEVRLVLVEPGARLDPRSGGAWSGAPGARFAFSADRRVEYAVGPRRFADLDGLRARLDELHAADPTRRLKLAPGPGVVTDEVVTVLDAVVGLGYEAVGFQGARDE
ncbi:MAG: biopolymer transporter ExbD [Planctomycetes bacterium]|nr:biopolymer transporter ExbD [Planctomycetota bacterium]